MSNYHLEDRTEIIVRFNEADPLGIVWHGHYLRYFEDGRESFGKKYGIAYLDCYREGFAVPVVSVHCDYKKPTRYGSTVIVVTTFKNTPAAKLNFDYQILDSETNALIATGYTTQVFVDAKSFQLQLTNPDFFEKWKKTWDLE